MSRLARSMRSLLLLAGFMASTAGAQTTAATDAPRFGFGRTATAQEIAGWDIDVRPDGHGVKKGKGTVAQGQDIYDAQCASCHGTFGESNRYMALAGGVKKEDLQSGRASALTQGRRGAYASAPSSIRQRRCGTTSTAQCRGPTRSR